MRGVQKGPCSGSYSFVLLRWRSSSGASGRLAYDSTRNTRPWRKPEAAREREECEARAGGDMGKHRQGIEANLAE